MTCDAEVAAGVWPPKDPNDIEEHEVTFEPLIARLWDKWTDFAAGQRMRVYSAGNASGYEFEANVSGRTGGRMPSLPTTIGAVSPPDGSLTWTCRALSSASLKTTVVGIPVWVVDAGVTVSGENVLGQVGFANIAGGTDGEDYTAVITATMADGTTRTIVGILPVRRAVRVCS